MGQADLKQPLIRFTQGGYVLTDPTSEIQIRAIPYAGWPFFVGDLCWGHESHEHHNPCRLGTDGKLCALVGSRRAEREQGIHSSGATVRGRALPQPARLRQGAPETHRRPEMDERRRNRPVRSRHAVTGPKPRHRPRTPRRNDQESHASPETAASDEADLWVGETAA